MLRGRGDAVQGLVFFESPGNKHSTWPLGDTLDQLLKEEMNGRMKLDLCLTPFTKINLKQIKDLFVRPETVKLQKRIGKNLLDIGLSNDLWNMTLKTKATKQKINK